MLETIRSSGPIPFPDFQETALYHPTQGFYATGNGAGRGGDFITSPEVGPLFGQVMAIALDEWWFSLERPRPFYFIEVGAGTGTLAASIMAAEPQCAPHLRYVMVERSETLRLQQSNHFPMTDPSELYDKLPAGPHFFSMSEMPTEKLTGVIFSNELLDNLTVTLLEYWHRRWNEVRIGVNLAGDPEETLVPIDDQSVVAAANEFGKGAKDGNRLAIQKNQQNWLKQSLNLLEAGRVVAIDYATTSDKMLVTSMEKWLRTYKNQRPGGAPWTNAGLQDITCDIAVDQLEYIAKPVENRSQTEFLNHHDLNSFVAEARSKWHDSEGSNNLASLRARATVNESRALTDEDGLGAHRVLEWEVALPEHQARQ